MGAMERRARAARREVGGRGAFNWGLKMVREELRRWRKRSVEESASWRRRSERVWRKRGLARQRKRVLRSMPRREDTSVLERPWARRWMAASWRGGRVVCSWLGEVKSFFSGAGHCGAFWDT